MPARAHVYTFSMRYFLMLSRKFLRGPLLILPSSKSSCSIASTPGCSVSPKLTLRSWEVLAADEFQRVLAALNKQCVPHVPLQALFRFGPFRYFTWIDICSTRRADVIASSRAEEIFSLIIWMLTRRTTMSLPDAPQFYGCFHLHDFSPGSISAGRKTQWRCQKVLRIMDLSKAFVVNLQRQNFEDVMTKIGRSMAEF